MTYLPYLLGAYIGSKYSKIKENFKIMTICLTYFTMFTILFILYDTKSHRFDFSSYEMICISFIPWVLFVVVGFICYIFGLEKKYLLTISLGAGLKNVGLAILIINKNFSSLESDYAIAILLNLLLVGQLPVYFWPFIDNFSIKFMKFYDCYSGPKEELQNKDKFDYMVQKAKKYGEKAEKKGVILEIWGDQIQNPNFTKKITDYLNTI